MNFPSLEELGLYDYILPWLFAFSVSYYLLGLIFRKDGKPLNRINIVLASIIAFFLTTYQPASQTIRGFFTGLFGEYVIYAIIFLFVLVILKVLGLDFILTSPLAPLKSLLTGKPLEETKKDTTWSGLTVLLVIGIAVLIFLNNFKINIKLPSIDQNLLILIIGVGAMLYLLIMVLGGKQNKEGEG